MFLADRKVSVNVHSVPSPCMIFMFYIHSDFNSPHLLLVLVNYDSLSLVDVCLVGFCCGYMIGVVFSINHYESHIHGKS